MKTRCSGFIRRVPMISGAAILLRNSNFEKKLKGLKNACFCHLVWLLLKVFYRFLYCSKKNSVGLSTFAPII
jgi:hypothetical protein